ncbi:disease resistance protein At4g27190-like, partial [Fagus crenata]
MIGIHGSGGVGKTMLVKNVARRAKEDKLFIKILVIDVSGTPNFDEIQESIAFQLGLSTFPRGHRHLGADLLRDRLMREKKILVIVDNIWKRSGLDLEDLGIAFGKDQKGCKFLLTSREES